MARVTSFDELDRIPVAGVNWRPLRRALGITAFGINAYTADAGELLIEPHKETSQGHEEIYVVISGRATFTVDGEEIDAPAGTVVFLDDPAQRREAVAAADGTTALAVGGKPGTITPSAWEHWFAAEAADDPASKYEIAAAGLSEHPDNPALHYNLACFAALAGRGDIAIEHLTRAVELKPEARDWAAGDSDLDPIRSDPRYPA